MGLDIEGVISGGGEAGVVGGGSAILHENFSSYARFGGATRGARLGGVNFMQPHSLCHEYVNTIEGFGVGCGRFYNSSGGFNITM